jgi:hypothetical protein
MKTLIVACLSDFEFETNESVIGSGLVNVQYSSQIPEIFVRGVVQLQKFGARGNSERDQGCVQGVS